MKRILITLLSILIGFPLVLGGILGLTYYFTGEASVPVPEVKVLGTPIAVNAYEWHSPVFAGMMYKDFEKTGTEEATEVGNLDDTQMSIELPTGYISTAVVTGEDGVTRWEGDAQNLAGYVFIDNGSYIMEILCQRAAVSGRGYGSFIYRAAFSVSVEPRIEASAEMVRQGDVLALRVFNLTGAPEVTGESVLGQVNFTPSGKGQMTAYVPIAYTVEADRFTVTVRTGDYVWRMPVTVVEYDFPQSESDVSYWSLGEAVSQYALNEKAQALEPLYQENDEECHWNGSFLMPVSGRVEVQYGEYVFDHQSPDYTQSAGIDILADTGTTVITPNAGRVVFAEELMNTGNTVVIEHGGGLKSYFFHLDSLKVEAGEMVARGDEIGEVGETGATAESKLHYEVRIGSRAIDPMLILDGESAIFHFQ